MSNSCDSITVIPPYVSSDPSVPPVEVGSQDTKIKEIVENYLNNDKASLSSLEKEIIKNKISVNGPDNYIKTVCLSLNDALKSLGRLRPWDQKKSLTLFLERSIEKIVSIIDSTVDVCGLRGFFDKDYAKGSEIQKALTILSFITAISALLLRLGQFAILATASAGLITVLVLLSFVWPYINPIPRKIEGCQNITVETRCSTLILSSKRQEYLNALAEKVSPETPLLLQGGANIGKTTLIHALAQQSERGKHASLKGKRFFYLSADALKGGEFNKITTQIQRHGKDIVLVVDNLHLISRRKTTGMTELQKFILDNQSSKKCSVIAIENDQIPENKENILDYKTLKEKFPHKVNLEEMGAEEKEELLYETLLQKRERVLLTREQIQGLSEASHPLAQLHQKIQELKTAEKKGLFLIQINYQRTLQVARRIDELTVKLAKSKKPSPQLLAKHYVLTEVKSLLLATDPTQLKPSEPAKPASLNLSDLNEDNLT